MREYDTTSTLIGLAVGAALVIHLFKWMGVLSVAFFILKHHTKNGRGGKFPTRP